MLNLRRSRLHTTAEFRDAGNSVGYLGFQQGLVAKTDIRELLFGTSSESPEEGDWHEYEFAVTRENMIPAQSQAPAEGRG